MLRNIKFTKKIQIGGYNDGVQTQSNTYVEAPMEPSRSQAKSVDKNVFSVVKSLPLMTTKKRK